MSIIDYTLFPRSDLDVDYWMLPEVGRSLFDFFDIFDPLDLSRLDSRLDWIVRPDWIAGLSSSSTGRNVPVERPRKYRIAVDIRGINKQSVKTHVSEDKKKLVVYAKEGDIKNRDADNYTLREIKRTYKLPANAEIDKLASYMAPNGKLIIEIPLHHQPRKEQQQKKSSESEQKQKQQQQEEKPVQEKENDKEKAKKEFKVATTEGPIEDILPHVVDGTIEMRIHLPEVVDASKIRVTCKDNDLIVIVRDEQENWDDLSELFYYRRTPMPENTDFNALKCTLEGNHLTIKAPVKQQQHVSGVDGKGESSQKIKANSFEKHSGEANEKKAVT